MLQCRPIDTLGQAAHDIQARARQLGGKLMGNRTPAVEAWRDPMTD
jgi:hypothetical protein